MINADSKKSSTSHRRKGLRGLMALLFAAVSVIGIAQPASANQVDIGESGYAGIVYYWNTPRTNTLAQNMVLFYEESNGGGGCEEVAIRPGLSSSGTYARASGCWTYHQWVTLQNDNGNWWVPAGTFYLSTEMVDTACGGGGCGIISWSGKLQWNVPY